jgi:DNA-directed RNA polymerase specialized sigma subunit
VLCEDLSTDIKIHDKIFGQSILGGDEFIEWVTEEFLIKAITREKGIHRQIAMELLYRVGGLKGEEIGEIMGVGYTSVSQERRRLLARLSKDRELDMLFREDMLNFDEVQRCFLSF